MTSECTAEAPAAVRLPRTGLLAWHTVTVSVTWDELVTFATTLPHVAESTSYRTPALKVAGKLMCRLRTDAEGLLALRCSPSDKAALVDGDDPAFTTTDHYTGYDYVLVDLETVDRSELFELIDDAWHLVAPPKIRAERQS